MFPIECKIKCTPFWKNSSFWTVRVQAMCSLVLGIQAMENSLALQTNHCTNHFLKLFVLSLYSAKVETEVQ